jgi:hypothetical protein
VAASKFQPANITFSHLNVVWEIPADWCETASVARTLRHAERYLCSLGFADQFLFVVTSDAENLTVAHPERVVVIQTSDEAHGIPAYVDDVFMVFKFYQPVGAMPGNLRVLPLGCNQDVPTYKPLAMADRSVDLFFSGREHGREHFFSAIDECYPNASGQLDGRPLNIDFARAVEFKAGMSPADFGRQLAKTRIALCPKGVSHETFRVYEALRAGAVVIAERQHRTWFNEGWPVIEVDDWCRIDRLVETLLPNDAALQQFSEAGHAWWRDICSPEATGHYLVRECVSSMIRRGVVNADPKAWQAVATAFKSNRAAA